MPGRGGAGRVRAAMLPVVARRSSNTPTRIDPDDRVVVLHGKDAFLRGMYLDQLRDALAGAGVEADTIRFDGASAELAEVLDECRSFGLMQQHKLVVVDKADELLKDRDDEPRGKGAARPRDAVQRYAEHPSDSATLVLRAERWNRGKLDKAIEKVGAVIKCEPPPPAKAADWAVGRARKRYERDLARDAAAALVEKLGPDLGKIDTEVAKLSAAVAPGEPIGLSLVHEMVGFTREEQVWQIQELILSGDREVVLSKLHELLTVSRVPPILCRYAMVDLARKVHGVAAGFATGASQSVLDSNLRLWGGSKARVVGAARRSDPGPLADLLREAVEADLAAKSGGTTDEVRAIERLAVRFASVLG